MLEGVVAGIVGSAFAVSVVLIMNRLFENLSTNPNFGLFSGFTVGSTESLLICIAVVVTGILIGAVGSGFAVSRYLDV